MPFRVDWLKPGMTRSWLRGSSVFARRLLALYLGLPLVIQASDQSSTNEASAYPAKVEKILATYCYDCHGDGMEKGKVAFDQFTSHDEMLARKEVFFAALKNVRAGIMPPEKKPRPDAEEQQALAE